MIMQRRPLAEGNAARSAVLCQRYSRCWAHLQLSLVSAGVPVIKGHPQPADKHDIDAMSLHSSDSEEAGIALGNAPELPNGAPANPLVVGRCMVTIHTQGVCLQAAQHGVPGLGSQGLWRWTDQEGLLPSSSISLAAQVPSSSAIYAAVQQGVDALAKWAQHEHAQMHSLGEVRAS